VHEPLVDVAVGADRPARDALGETLACSSLATSSLANRCRVGRLEVIVLDTHAAIWLTTDRGLGRQSQRIVDKALSEDRLAISAISFWGLAMLTAKGRLRSLKPASERRGELIAAGVRELPVSGEIAILAAEIENLNGEPADRIIAATAIAHEAILLTADEKLLRWRHRLKRQDADK
jgi:PIN domain nuclease of toxin-antitoxin system